MRQYLITIDFIILLLFLSCNNVGQNNNSLPRIDIEANINKMEIINLSQFTDDIRYVPFENIENIPIIGFGLIDISGNMFLVSNGVHVLLFDSEGHFIRKIGNKGRGPGEYPTAANIGLGSGKNQKIYVSSTFDIYEYNIDGSFIDKYTKSLLVNDAFFMKEWLIINDSLFFGYIRNLTGKTDYKAMIINKHSNIIYAFKNYILNNSESGYVFDGSPQLFEFEGSIFFKEQFNDTLFLLNDNYKLIPKYIFNLGNFILPLSIRKRKPMGEIMKNYIMISKILQTEKYLLIICDFGNNFPAKRLTPTTSFPGAPQWWYNTTAVLGLYNKQSGELVFSKPTTTDNPLFTTGIYNDIDCGPRFSPKRQINDSTMVMWVKPDELKTYIASNEFKNSVPKYPEKKKQLEELANRITVLDNPILMIVTFKK